MTYKVFLDGTGSISSSDSPLGVCGSTSAVLLLLLLLSNNND